MEIIRDIAGIRRFVAAQRQQGKRIGLVPTMGYLHEGHLSLVQVARDRAEIVIMSIFVNPLQFGVNEDLDRYPRDLERDSRLAEAAGVAAIFSPSAEEMYPPGFCTSVEVEKLTEGLCGRSRPGHFRGVTTVVCKLFNCVQPEVAVFGQKDAQQAAIIRKMTSDLNLPVEIIVAPIVREEDGLAMSSRNVYLTAAERQAALVLSRSLQLARQMVARGEREAGRLRQAISEMISSEPAAKIDYVEIVGAADLAPVEQLSSSTLIAVAVRFGTTRLIDNVVVEV